ncbi:MAG: TIGR02646 family protein [Magnetococcales bacterium]|nr:TIGR02646 family protein [Magnetococcales bacterium]
MEPPCLTAHRKTSYSDYDNYAGKNALRHALVSEQRGLCCYCMGRISDDRSNIKIEHWHCQDNYQAEQLTYQNLLGACLGGEGLPRDKQHCDTRKGNQDLQWNPANPVHFIEAHIRYGTDGTIRSDDSVFNGQLDEVLNLNLAILKNNRKGVLDAVLFWWRQEKSRLHGPVPRDRLERKRNQYVGGNGVIDPYCQVAVWWLDQKLARVAT